MRRYPELKHGVIHERCPRRGRQRSHCRGGECPRRGHRSCVSPRFSGGGRSRNLTTCPRRGHRLRTNHSIYMSYIVNYQHCVWRTHRSVNAIPLDTQVVMLKFIHEMSVRDGWTLIRINACLNHVHMLIGVPKHMDVATIMNLVKGRTSQEFKGHKLLPIFDGWASGYAAFSVGYSQIPQVKEYIANQHSHHLKEDMSTEFERILHDNGLTPGEFLWKNI